MITNCKCIINYLRCISRRETPLMMGDSIITGVSVMQLSGNRVRQLTEAYWQHSVITPQCFPLVNLYVCWGLLKSSFGYQNHLETGRLSSNASLPADCNVGFLSSTIVRVEREARNNAARISWVFCKLGFDFSIECISHRTSERCDCR